MNENLLAKKHRFSYRLTSRCLGNYVVNDAVVAHFEGMPCRGVVSALLPNKKAKIKFVDFGNIELYDSSELSKLSPEFLAHPQLVRSILILLSDYLQFEIVI